MLLVDHVFSGVLLLVLSMEEETIYPVYIRYLLSL